MIHIDNLINLLKKYKSTFSIIISIYKTKVIHFDSCASLVGRQVRGGMQRLMLAPACLTRHGTIMHQFLHALGFYHEISRGDRDTYVTINFDNIRAGAEGNFRRLIPGVNVSSCIQFQFFYIWLSKLVKRNCLQAFIKRNITATSFSQLSFSNAKHENSSVVAKIK